MDLSACDADGLVKIDVKLTPSRKSPSRKSPASPRIFKTWLQKAHNRGLIINEDHLTLQDKIETIATKLNKYINTIGKK